ncbi:MAG: ABC transporter substrate-binding protein, partial [Caulobacteraceae bacterium]|nr:ABC transporter substrate-binding protein [Caulobacteraceae bacterium]
MVLAPQSLIDSRPKVVRAFVEASAAGWAAYLHGDPSPGDRLILKDNPEMTPDVLAQARDKMRQSRIVDGDDAGPPGRMTDARWQAFFKVASGEGVYPPSMDWKSAYSLQFMPAGVPTR